MSFLTFSYHSNAGSGASVYIHLVGSCSGPCHRKKAGSQQARREYPELPTRPSTYIQRDRTQSRSPAGRPNARSSQSETERPFLYLCQRHVRPASGEDSLHMSPRQSWAKDSRPTPTFGMNSKVYGPGWTARTVRNPSARRAFWYGQKRFAKRDRGADGVRQEGEAGE